jgi:hypothetical protein
MILKAMSISVPDSAVVGLCHFFILVGGAVAFIPSKKPFRDRARRMAYFWEVLRYEESHLDVAVDTPRESMCVRFLGLSSIKVGC